MVGTYRSDEVHGRRHPVGPFVHELARSGQATRLELSPFTRKELRDQIAAITGETPDPILVDRLLARSEGNPLFAEELLASARANAGLPESLKDALLWRLESVPPDARQILGIAAVVGRTVDDALLAAVAGLANGELTAALRAAVDGNILTHDPESTGYSFRHALLREAIYGDLLPGQRRALHTTVAETLAKRPELAGSAAAPELAYHWHAAGRLPEALRASVDAGLSAERIHALAEALLHYEQALGIWDAAGDKTAGTWDLVFPKLRAVGHQVWIPSLTGLENDANLLTPAIGLQTHIDDVVRLLTHEDLQDVTLVGHSYAGMIITGVAENALHRLNRLVYVDAFVPCDGQSALDLLPEPVVQSFRQQAENAGEGWRLKGGEGQLDMWGLRAGPARDFVRSRLSDFSLNCFQEAIRAPANAAAKLP